MGYSADLHFRCPNGHMHVRHISDTTEIVCPDCGELFRWICEIDTTNGIAAIDPVPVFDPDMIYESSFTDFRRSVWKFV